MNLPQDFYRLLSFFSWPLCCLSFDLWLLLTHLVSSNSSLTWFQYNNFRENRSRNQEWTIQRNWRHWVHKTQDEDKQSKKTQHRQLRKGEQHEPTKNPVTNGEQHGPTKNPVTNGEQNGPTKNPGACDKVCQCLVTGPAMFFSYSSFCHQLKQFLNMTKLIYYQPKTWEII